MSTVYLLGSGFSKAIHPEMPTLTELSEIVCKKFKNELDRFPLSKYKDNVEELLTYLYTEHPWKNISIIHKDKFLYYEISEYITEELKRLQGNYNTNSDFELQKLIKYLDSYKLSVITFNYDTLIEKLFFQYVNNQIHMPCLWRIPIRNFQSRVATLFVGNTINTFHLIKLHGSINWHFAGDFNVGNDDLYYDSSYSSNPLITYPFAKDDLKPFIIPPVMDKSIFYKNGILKSIWDNAHKSLNNASKIVMVGYSIPQSDYSSQMLLKSAIKDDTEIVIVNTDTRDEFRKRMKDIFGDKIKDDFKYCCDNALIEYINNEIQ